MSEEVEVAKAIAHIESIFGHLKFWGIIGSRDFDEEKLYPNFFIFTVRVAMEDLEKMKNLAQLHGLILEHRNYCFFLNLHYPRLKRKQRVSLFKRLQKFLEYIRLGTFKS